MIYLDMTCVLTFVVSWLFAFVFVDEILCSTGTPVGSYVGTSVGVSVTNSVGAPVGSWVTPGSFGRLTCWFAVSECSGFRLQPGVSFVNVRNTNRLSQYTISEVEWHFFRAFGKKCHLGTRGLVGHEVRNLCNLFPQHKSAVRHTRRREHIGNYRQRLLGFLDVRPNKG